MKKRIIVTVLISVFDLLFLVGCGNNSLPNNTSTVNIVEFSGNETERMCEYLSDKIENILSEVDGIETVSANVYLEEGANEYSVDIEFTLSDNYEKESIIKTMEDILSKTYKFENVNIAELSQ